MKAPTLWPPKEIWDDSLLLQLFCLWHQGGRWINSGGCWLCSISEDPVQLSNTNFKLLKSHLRRQKPQRSCWCGSVCQETDAGADSGCNRDNRRQKNIPNSLHQPGKWWLCCWGHIWLIHGLSADLRTEIADVAQLFWAQKWFWSEFHWFILTN